MFEMDFSGKTCFKRYGGKEWVWKAQRYSHWLFSIKSKEYLLQVLIYVFPKEENRYKECLKILSALKI